MNIHTSWLVTSSPLLYPPSTSSEPCSPVLLPRSVHDISPTGLQEEHVPAGIPTTPLRSRTDLVDGLLSFLTARRSRAKASSPASPLSPQGCSSSPWTA